MSTSKSASLSELYSRLEAAAPTLPLATQASDIVPGEGLATAEVLCIGEAPGYFESVERRPFVGKSGQLFRRTLTEVGILPEQVYITNIVKVRPPDNRDPLPAEILAFKPYLDEEIQIIAPLLVVTLGRFSMAKFLPDVKISQVHGRLHKVNWQGQQLFVLPMFHPAAALRATNVKESFIQDFAKIPKVLEHLKKVSADVAAADDVKSALL
jgi:uracil-DNA glycosylase family 4